MSAETFMLTGSMGCIGAWTLRNLVREGVRVVATDLATDPVRPRQVMSAEEVAQITEQHLEPSPDFGSNLNTDYIIAMARVKGSVKTLLDIDAIIAADASAAIDVAPAKAA